jgi:glycosyltransferase involved in cell wall biosynthesis
MEKKLSIIIPIYNEENLVEKSLPPVFNLPINKEVVVVDDGSSDNSYNILKSLQKKYSFKLIKKEINEGKGRAVKTGLNNISGNYFIVSDADLEYSPKDIVFLFNKVIELNQKKLAIYGSRFINNKNISFHYLVNSFLTKITNLLYSSKLTDMETCFKLIPTEALDIINLDGKRFEIEPEITAKLLKAGYKIKEFPISYNRRNYKEGKKIKPKDGLLAIKTLIREKFKQ